MISIYRASNNAEADVLVSVLSSHGIQAIVQGYQHRSLLGVLGPYIHLNVLVPEPDEAEARRLIGEMQTEETPPPQTHPKISRRRPAVAAMLAFLLPGLGSLYIGRNRLGGWLLAGSLLSLAFLYLQSHAGASRHAAYAALGLAALMAGDLASVITHRYDKRPNLTVLPGDADHD